MDRLRKTQCTARPYLQPRLLRRVPAFNRQPPTPPTRCILDTLCVILQVSVFETTQARVKCTFHTLLQVFASPVPTCSPEGVAMMTAGPL